MPTPLSGAVNFNAVILPVKPATNRYTRDAHETLITYYVPLVLGLKRTSTTPLLQSQSPPIRQLRKHNHPQHTPLPFLVTNPNSPPSVVF